MPHHRKNGDGGTAATPGGGAEASDFGGAAAINGITVVVSVGIDAPADGFAFVSATGVAAISQTRVLPATKGTNTYRLICDTDAAADSLAIVNPVINALFVPTDISAP